MSFVRLALAATLLAGLGAACSSPSPERAPEPPSAPSPTPSSPLADAPVTPADPPSDAGIEAAAPPPTHGLGGAATGLDASTRIVLRNAGDDVVVSGSGSFHFAAIAEGSPYSVTVASAPSGVTCMITHGAGTMPDHDVGDVGVSCRLSFCAFAGAFDDGTAGRFLTPFTNDTNLAVLHDAAAGDTAFGLRLTGWSGKLEGAVASYDLARPHTMSWWERVGPSGGASGYVVPSDDAGRFVFWMYAYGGEWVADYGNAHHAATLGAWTHFVATFDWDAGTYSITVDGDPFVGNAAFQIPGANGIAHLDLFHFNFDATSDYDEFEFACPAP